MVSNMHFSMFRTKSVNILLMHLVKIKQSVLFANFIMFSSENKDVYIHPATNHIFYLQIIFKHLRQLIQKII